MHTGDGFLLIYSITDDQTLEEIRDIREQILRVHRDKQVLQLSFQLLNSNSVFLFVRGKVPMVLLGNKLDLAKTQRAVSKEEGKALAQEFGASFVEISVCT